MKFRAPLSFLFVLALFGTSSCSLFSDEGDFGDIIVRESIPFTFTVNGDDFCPPQQDCTAGGTTPVDINPPDIELPATAIDVVALTGNEELASIAENLKSIEIESVTYEYVDNTLNFASPRVVLYLGPIAATSRNDAGVVLVADVPSVAAMTSTSADATVDAESQAAGGELLKSLKVAGIPLLRPSVIPKDSAYPAGSAEVTISVNLKFVGNPFEAALD